MIAETSLTDRPNIECPLISNNSSPEEKETCHNNGLCAVEHVYVHYINNQFILTINGIPPNSKDKQPPYATPSLPLSFSLSLSLPLSFSLSLSSF